MGALIYIFYFFWKEPYSLAHEQFFWNIKHSTMEAPLSLDPSCKMKMNAFIKSVPFQVIYMSVQLWANHMG
jgi:hypothetical protein